MLTEGWNTLDLYLQVYKVKLSRVQMKIPVNVLYVYQQMSGWRMLIGECRPSKIKEKRKSKQREQREQSQTAPATIDVKIT